MSKTRTFKDYIDYLERLKEKDPLFLRYCPQVKLRNYESIEDKECRTIVPQSNMHYVVGGNSKSFNEILNSIGMERSEVIKTQEVKEEGSRHPHPPTLRYGLKLTNDLVGFDALFESGDNPRKVILFYNPNKDYHQEWEVYRKDSFEDGEMNQYTIAIINSCYAKDNFQKKLELLLENYDLDEKVEIHSNRKVKTFREWFGWTQGYRGDTRATVDVNLLIMNEIIKRKIPAIINQANQSNIFAVNEIVLKY